MFDSFWDSWCSKLSLKRFNSLREKQNLYFLLDLAFVFGKVYIFVLQVSFFTVLSIILEEQSSNTSLVRSAQKQPPVVFWIKDVLRNFAKLQTSGALMMVFLFNNMKIIDYFGKVKNKVIYCH